MTAGVTAFPSLRRKTSGTATNPTIPAASGLKVPCPPAASPSLRVPACMKKTASVMTACSPAAPSPAGRISSPLRARGAALGRAIRERLRPALTAPPQASDMRAPLPAGLRKPKVSVSWCCATPASERRASPHGRSAAAAFFPVRDIRRGAAGRPADIHTLLSTGHVVIPEQRLHRPASLPAYGKRPGPGADGTVPMS